MQRYCTPGHKPRLHEHQVPNPDSNLDHNPYGRGGLSLDLNPVYLHVNANYLDQDLDQNPYVNGAIDTSPKLGLIGDTFSRSQKCSKFRVLFR